MNKELSGKGYIQGGEGYFITSTGERYHYHDGKLTQAATLTSNKPQGVIEMQGTFELQPLSDSRKSFYRKAFVERYTTNGGTTRLVLRSYDTIVAVLSPLGEEADGTEAYRVEIAMRCLSATTLRHVKEFLAQADDTFRGITLAWLRKAVESGRPIEGEGKVYTLNELRRDGRGNVTDNRRSYRLTVQP